MEDFEAAIDSILAGPEKKNRVLEPQEKRRVVYHEAGHAMVAEHVPTGSRCIKFPLFHGASLHWLHLAITRRRKIPVHRE
jgi:ATP-dependent Zn protease